MANPKAASRKTIEQHLMKAIITALDELNLPQDARHLCRVFRALVGVGLDCMSAGDAPVEVVALHLDRALSTRRSKLTKRQEASPGTLGSCVQKPGKA